MKVLLACEESQAVTKEFRRLGHEAYSCDILDQSGGHPEWHIQDDVLKVINDGWDMMIAFPPCTHLAVSGARWFPAKRDDGSQREAIIFFMEIINANIPRIAVENPVNIIGGEYITQHFPDLTYKYDLPLKPTQTIQPYYFGDNSRKTTNLWLKNLPKLVHFSKDTIFGKKTHVEPDIYTCKNGKTFSRDYMVSLSAGENRGHLRSKTYLGIAKAMAEQWSDLSTYPILKPLF